MPLATVVWRVLLFLAGIFIGAFVAYNVYESSGKKQLKEQYDAKTETQKAPVSIGQQKDYVPVQIKAPMLDKSGVALGGDELDFMAYITDLSTESVAVISHNYLKKGHQVEMICKQNELSFSRHATVGNTYVYGNGLRIELQFTEPLEKV
jgi:hypothetical protein